jgi:hypothetical protein
MLTASHFQLSLAYNFNDPRGNRPHNAFIFYAVRLLWQWQSQFPATASEANAAAAAAANSMATKAKKLPFVVVVFVANFAFHALLCS